MSFLETVRTVAATLRLNVVDQYQIEDKHCVELLTPMGQTIAVEFDVELTKMDPEDRALHSLLEHEMTCALTQTFMRRKERVKKAVRLKSVYVIGAMKNPRVLEVSAALRAVGLDVFEDWHSSGPEADLFWQQYEQKRGRTFREALAGYHAQHAFAFDKHHLDRCDIGVLVLPAGKSAHLELGYLVGQRKPAYILMEGEPEKFDLMYLFATAIFLSVEEMIEGL